MKIILAIFSALIAFSAQAATLTPIQLLNPVGSTSGQAILSTGPTTAPAWGNVSLSTLTGILPIANGGTGQSSATAALTALGGLSTTTAASTYLTQANAATTYGAKASPLSQFAATTSAQLAGVISDETGTGALVFANSPALAGSPTAPSPSAGNSSTQIATTAFTQAEVALLLTQSPVLTTPAISQPNIVGVTTNSNAAAGSVGEYLTNSGTGASLTSNTSANATSVSLTAGDWDVSGVISTVPAGTTTTSLAAIGVSTTPATFGAANTGTAVQLPFSAVGGVPVIMNSPTVRISLASTTTVYLVCSVTFAVSTMTANGFIRARRVR